MMPEIWSVKDRIFCHFGLLFVLLPPLTIQKVKKTPGDIIILHNCTKNHDHMLHCSWWYMTDVIFYFSFWAIFRSFTPLKARKIKILKNQQKCFEMLSFLTSVWKIIIICYTVPEVWCVIDIRKIKIKKNWE